MNILADKAMPYWEECFRPLGRVETFSAGALNEKDRSTELDPQLAAYLPEVDCLLVRSTTKVDDALLAKMPNVRFIATATAGVDHFDIQALEARNISWYAAGGCNAQAVAQYVVCALLHLAQQDKFLIVNKSVGIVGHGNVGSRVAKVLRALGADVLIYDPPQQRALQAKSTISYAEFSDILQADIICVHAPLNSHKDFPSYHLFDEQVLAGLNSEQYIINAGRGEVIDNLALLAQFQADKKHNRNSVNVVLDVWENEPHINTALIPNLRLASAHIAGHTLDGKARGTVMLYEQLCQRAGLAQSLNLKALLPVPDIQLTAEIDEAIASLDPNNPQDVQALCRKLCHLVYDIQNDDRVFRRHMAQFTSFAKLRQEYPIRREFSALTLNATHTKINELLHGIGFIISNDSTTLQ